MTVMMFITYLSTFIASSVVSAKFDRIIGNLDEERKAYVWWNVISFVKTILTLLSLWIGIYTFNMFALKPFVPQAEE